LSVAALAAGEEDSPSCCSGISPGVWNRIQREVASSDLFSARLELAGRDPEPTFQVVDGIGPAGIRRAVSTLGCDLVVVPTHGPLPGSLVRRVRRRVNAEVIGVRAH
jgi:nucleotide-binding universal stress UspA family protein